MADYTDIFGGVEDADAAWRRQLQDFLAGAQDQYQRYIGGPLGSGYDRLLGSVAPSAGTVEPGPRFYNQGMPRPPSMRYGTSSPEPMGPQMPFPGQGMADQFAPDRIEQAIQRAEGGDGLDQLLGGPITAPTPVPSDTRGVPPQGDAHRNEYEAMVKEYLQKLANPPPFPQPEPLTGWQTAAVMLNPNRRQELMHEYLDQPYQRRLAEFQYQQGTQGRAAQLAGQLAEHESETARRDADRAWARENTLANAGGSVPAGYVWKNPELEAVWKQKKREKDLSEQRTNEYLARGTRGKPANRQAHLKELYSERVRLEGMLTSPGAQQWMIMKANGVSDPQLDSTYGGMSEELQAKKDLEATLSAMDDTDYKEFMAKDGTTQAKIVREYIQALRERGQSPAASTTTSATSEPIEPPPPE